MRNLKYFYKTDKSNKVMNSSFIDKMIAKYQLMLC